MSFGNSLIINTNVKHFSFGSVSRDKILCLLIAIYAK